MTEPTAQQVADLIERRRRVAESRVNRLTHDLKMAQAELTEMEGVLLVYEAMGVRPSEGFIPALELPKAAE